jgi:hypothetical protein
LYVKVAVGAVAAVARRKIIAVKQLLLMVELGVVLVHISLNL